MDLNGSSNIVLIIGAAGFLGRYAAKHFHEQGWSVIGIDAVTPENAPLANLDHYYSMQLPSPELAPLLTRHSPNLCLHCAGRASVGLSMDNPLADYYSGPVLTFELLNALRTTTPDCRFIFLSSAAVYGNPTQLPISETQEPAPISPYGFHKWQGEQLCLEFARVYGMRTASLRIFSAYGAGLRRQVLWDMCRKVVVEKRLVLQGSGRESRDFIHAQDIADAIGIVADRAPLAGEVYNLGVGQETTILALAQHIIDTLGSPLHPEFDGSVPKGMPLNWCADISQLNALGFTPTVSLERGVAQFATWCKTELEGL